MATIHEIKKTRLKKLKALETTGFVAYPAETKRTHTCSEAIAAFSELSRAKKEVIVTGRIRSLREHGGLVFSHIADGTGSLQVLFKKNALGEKGFQFFLDYFDVGDFIETRGTLFKTKKGEKTLEVKDYRLLVKSLLPLPEKWHGLKDVEERYRKRYLDLLFNDEVKKKFETRAALMQAIREFLEQKGFMEVETPVLQPLYGGAKAEPFTTRLNAFDMNMYLRIAPELYLKRLLVGGFDKVYEIGRMFRNEGVDKSHNPDFTMLEFYWAYADYKQMMQMTEQLFDNMLKTVFGTTKITYEGKTIDFKAPWKRIEFSDLIKKHTKINLDEINQEALKKEARKLGITPKGGKAEIADQIYKKACRDTLVQPTFVLHHPEGAFPLAKGLEKDSTKTANFQLVVAGFELINAFSELNDPREQRKRLEEQEKIRQQGFGEAQRLDEDYLKALEYGMPPAAGFGMGIDRLTALLTDSHALREVILFPTMKPK